MKVFVAGASGVVGRLLIPLLVREGYQVFGTSRSEQALGQIKSSGAQPVKLDIFDREAVHAVLQEVKPDAVIHQLTSLSARDFAEHARVRTEGTRNLVDASLKAGVSKMVAQSISWAYVGGNEPAREEEPLDLEAQEPRKTTVDAVYALEKAVMEMPEFVILRYGMFYGSGTWYAPGGYMAEQLHKRQLPATEGVTSFIHVEDAAHAAVQALKWPSGAYNITDGEPAPGTEWLPIFAKAVGAPAPELKAGRSYWERGAHNGKAAQLGWKPRYRSWREGFAAGLR